MHQKGKYELGINRWAYEGNPAREKEGFCGTKRGLCRLKNQFEGARESSIVKVRYRLDKVQLVIQR